MSDQTSVETEQALYLLGFSESSPVAEDVVSCSPLLGSDHENEQTVKQMLEQYGIEFLDSGTVRAWYKLIDRDQFEGDVGERNLSDIEWLTPRVIAHETVVSILSNRSAFYPSRFGTLFSTHQKLSCFASGVSDQLSFYFENMAGRCEWGVKFFANMAMGTEILARKNGMVEDGKPTGGASYLKLRSMQRDRTLATRSMFGDSCSEAITALQGTFADVAARPLRSHSSEASSEELLGHMAVLVGKSESDQLTQWGNEWNQNHFPLTGLRVELLGPWPTYSFCPVLVPKDEIARAA